jgi:hypothetical protein
MNMLPNKKFVISFALVAVLAAPIARAADDDKDLVHLVPKGLSKTKHGIGKVFKGIGTGFKKLGDKLDGDKKTDTQTPADAQAAPPPPAGEEVAPPPPPGERGRPSDVVYTWSTDTKYIVREGRHTGAPEKGEVRLSSTESRQYYSYDPSTIQVPVYQCSSTSGNGSSSNWNGYFNVPRDQKAKALADTIKGVGKSTADRLVANNAFDHKPRSWSEFVQIIERQDDYIDGLYNNVVVKFGAENRQALGYGSTSASADDCVITGYRNKRVYVETFHDEVVPGSTRWLTFDLNIQGGELLPAEKETFTVYFNRDRGVWVEAPTYYNSYSVTSLDGSTRDGYAEKVASGSRNRVKPPVSLTVYAKPNNGRVDLEVTDNNYISESTLGDRYAIYTVIQERAGGDQAIGGQQSATMKPGTWTKVETTAAPDMTKGSALFGATKNNVRAFGKVRIKYKNSAYYNEEMSDDVRSSSADFGPKRR